MSQVTLYTNLSLDDIYTKPVNQNNLYFGSMSYQSNLFDSECETSLQVYSRRPIQTKISDSDC